MNKPTRVEFYLDGTPEEEIRRIQDSRPDPETKIEIASVPDPDLTLTELLRNQSPEAVRELETARHNARIECMRKIELERRRNRRGK